MLAASCSQQAVFGRSSLEVESGIAQIDLEGGGGTACCGAVRIAPASQQQQGESDSRRSLDAAFSPNTSSLLSGAVGEKKSGELAMRKCFGEAFDLEIEHLSSLNIPISKERKRQILADILVWAEVTQDHYDISTRSFVLEPNKNDESFLRVGKFLRERKQHYGIQD